MLERGGMSTRTYALALSGAALCGLGLTVLLVRANADDAALTTARDTATQLRMELAERDRTITARERELAALQAVVDNTERRATRAEALLARLEASACAEEVRRLSR